MAFILFNEPNSRLQDLVDGDAQIGDVGRRDAWVRER